MSRWFWVRHAPTHARRMIGWTDIPADLGDTERIARLDAMLPRGALVISSDLLRATMTADAITNGRTRLSHDAGLREIHFGAWEDRAHDEVHAETPDLIRAFWDQPGPTAPPGGESWGVFAGRVNAAVDRIAAAHPDRDIIAVAHFGTILTQIERALGLPTIEAFAQRIENLSLTELHRTDSGWTTGRINHHP
ncbi:histidine phosphatase family protein [Halodurantibacterium flavum]|uniref:Histidine phosphatase family protein n=1 Tax=Halodurantibacterium flavum TaxID=1382802 RepID=A0ABW4S9W2_9RHOB